MWVSHSTAYCELPVFVNVKSLKDRADDPIYRAIELLLDIRLLLDGNPSGIAV